MSAGTLSPIPASAGLLHHMIKSVRPDLADIAERVSRGQPEPVE